MTTKLVTEFFGDDREAVISMFDQRTDDGHQYEVILAKQGKIVGKQAVPAYSVAKMIAQKWATKGVITNGTK